MEDVNISKFRAQVVRAGSTPASPGFVVSEGQNPVDPSGSGQNHLPVTIATASTGLSITESQVLGGAGTVGQYIRGDGSLADFPATTGGGSSVSYYLNGSVSQGTIGGVAYKELNRTPVFGAGTDITINADGYIASFITDAGDPNKLLIPAGNWNLETYFSASSSGGTPSFYVELYKYNGTTFTLIASSSSAPELIAFGTILNPYYSTLAVPETVLALTDRLALRYYVTHSGRTITLHTENNHLCQVITTFTTGLTALNGLTNQVQFFAVGTSGTDFAISSASDTHTFNLPTASATNRGALSSGDWTTFNNKTSNLGTVTSVGLSSATSGVTIGSTPITTSGTITLAIATASGSQNGLLSSTDWTTFNGKQNALTNPVTGTGTTNYLPKFTGSTTIGNSNLINDASGNLGLGVTPSSWGLGKAIEIGNIGNSVWGVNATQFNVLQNVYYDAVGFKYASSNAASYYQQASGAHAWYTAPSGTAGNAITFSTPMILTAAGRLLINTPTESTFHLDVNGTGRFSGNIAIGSNPASAAVGGVLRLPFDNAIRWRNSSNTADLGFYLGGSNLFTFDSGISVSGAATFTGDVTISKTSPTFRVTRGNTSSSSLVVYNTNGTDDWLIGTGVTGSNTDYRIYNNGLGADAIYILKSNNNVLIGTTTDSGARLRVNGGIIQCLDVYNNTTGAAANMQIDANGFFARSTSSIKYKRDIFNYDKGLNYLEKIRPVYYKGKSLSEGEKIYAGFIAEEIHELGLNEFVQYAQDGSPDALSYQNMVALLVKSIQELKQEIDTLKN